METAAIGALGSSPVSNTQPETNIRLEDFLKLFVAQLNYQDPLEPINNREFLAQLAQFSSLELNRQGNDSLNSMLSLQTADQAVGLLSKTVEWDNSFGQTLVGQITGVNFTTNGSSLTVKTTDGAVLSGITLAQIKLIK
jgi:flagellar basal-body rod modification protein FlgD